MLTGAGSCSKRIWAAAARLELGFGRTNEASLRPVDHMQWHHEDAPWPWTRLALVRMLTHSSAAVGWMPTVESKWDFLAPALSAMAMPCMISAESGPTMCAPNTCRPSKDLRLLQQTHK